MACAGTRPLPHGAAVPFRSQRPASALRSHTGVDIYRTVSVLGYCLLPIIVLAAISTCVELRGAVGYVLIPAAVLWSTNAAALFFVVLLGLDDQRWLVAYPVMLFYAVFALISVF